MELENSTPYFPLAGRNAARCSRCWLDVIEECRGREWIKPGKIVNNGAYVLEDWRILNDRMRLRKNPYYWNAKKVALETIEVLPIEKDTVAFNFYASGLADLSMDKG